MRNKVSEKFTFFKATIDNENNSLDIRKLLFVENKNNPAEIVEKLNDAVQYYGY
ncbi:unnamed protein product, partial [marine sediment metagenome]